MTWCQVWGSGVHRQWLATGGEQLFLRLCPARGGRAQSSRSERLLSMDRRGGAGAGGALRATLVFFLTCVPHLTLEMFPGSFVIFRNSFHTCRKDGQQIRHSIDVMAAGSGSPHWTHLLALWPAPPPGVQVQVASEQLCPRPLTRPLPCPHPPALRPPEVTHPAVLPGLLTSRRLGLQSTERPSRALLSSKSLNVVTDSGPSSLTLAFRSPSSSLPNPALCWPPTPGPHHCFP